MLSDVVTAGCDGASRSTVVRIFSEPQHILEERADSDWDNVIPLCREFVKLNKGSTIAVKTIGERQGFPRLVVRVFRSDQNGTLIEESPVAYNPYPLDDGGEEAWDAPQFRPSLFLQML